jgi:pre-mRNA-splicing factor ATP-dependent RNA helicase DHX15/PRP43
MISEKNDFNYKDFLDKNGNDMNFINGKPYSDEYKELAKKWSMFPVYKDYISVKKIINLLDTKQVILLTAGTGSGKTVIIPKFLYKYFIKKSIEGKIAVTTPKQLTTLSAAEYGAKTLDIKLGDEVGYSYKDAPIESKSDITRLLYITDGLLLSIVRSKDKLLSEFTGIIVDEAHERNLQIDFLLKHLKDIVLQRPEFKVIIMSATINSEVFKKYFNVDKIKYGEIELSGEPNYPIERIWAENEYENFLDKYVKISLNKSIDILNKSKEDMIIFVPTQNDTSLGCILLKNRGIKTICVELHAKTSKNDKDLAKEKNTSENAKVIFATNVAESSLTFDGLKYVIDTGLELVNHFDSINGLQIIKKSFTTQAQIKQRIGRVGRTMPGIAYHLYTEEQYKAFSLYPEPNILTTDITDDILSLLNFYNIKELQEFLNDLITTPHQSQIDYSIYKLQFYNCLGFVEDNTIIGRITSIGKSILKIKNIDVISSYAILISKYLNCQNEIIIIMAIINNLDGGSIDKLFNYIKLKKFKNYIHKYSYINSDHITILNIYQHLYYNQKYEYLNIKFFKKIDKIISDIHKNLTYFNDSHYEYLNKYDLINIKPFDLIDHNIMYVLFKAYQFNLIKNGKTINLMNNVEGSLDFHNATITNNIQNNSNNFICHNIINRFGKLLFTCCTEIPEKIIK